MISALSWIPRGVSKLKLEHIADDDEEALKAMKLYASRHGAGDSGSEDADMMGTSDPDSNTDSIKMVQSQAIHLHLI